MKKKISLTEKAQWPRQTLFLSMALNVIFIAIFFYFFIRENPLFLTASYKPKENAHRKVVLSQDDFLSVLLCEDFSSLVSRLDCKHTLEYGLYERDLALSVLVYCFDIDLARALGVKLLPTAFIEHLEKSIPLYHALSDKDFAKIKEFLEEERWPQTAEGLFKLLKQELPFNDLKIAFCQTEEFFLVETLFASSTCPIKKKDLLNLICEGSWDTLKRFYETQRSGSDFSKEARREFLIDYLLQDSKMAASLLLFLDKEFIVKQMSDEGVAKVLELLDCTPQSIELARELAISLRKIEIKNKATAFLPQEESITYIRPPRAATGTLSPEYRQKPPSSPTPKEHIVQPGESLWLIARKYDVPLEEIMRLNQMQTTVLQVGKVLRLP